MPPSQGEFPPQAASASIVPSTNPSADADFILQLLPGRFVLLSNDNSVETSSNPLPKSASVTLIGNKDDDGDVIPPTAIIFVNFGSTEQQHTPLPTDADTSAKPNSSTTSTNHADLAPNATLILKDADLIASVANNNNYTSGTRTDETASWAIVRLSGGAILLASSVQGLYDYVNAVSTASVGGDGAGASESASVVESNAAMTDVDIREAAATTTTASAKSADISIEEAPYKFPSLAMSILSNKEVIPGFQINTRVGVPIESNLFVGQVLLIMRPPDATADPFYNDKVFSKKRRRFEIQIQGKFKYVPTGTVWCGFEVSDEMKLGLVSKGLCNLLLRLVSKTVPGDMHFSFGDKNNVELPHISFPAWTLFDKVVVTKPGEEPPPLGDVLPESAESASARKRSSSAGAWNTDDTYSFSYHSMYLDLPIWHVVNLPTKDIDLKSFWGDSLLRIVVYENGSGKSDKHLQNDNKYIAGIQAEYLGFDDESMNDMIEEQDALPLDEKRLSNISRSISYINLAPDTDDSRTTPPSPGLEAWENSTIESDDETTFYDATGLPRTESENALLEGGQIFVEMNSLDGQVETNYVASERPSNILLYDMLCPGWIEICSDKGKYTKAFAFATGGDDVIFCTVSEFAELFSVSEARRWVEDRCSPRLSRTEKQRRIMGHTLAACRDAPSPRSDQRCRALRKQNGCRSGNAFLQRAPPSPSDSKTKVRGQNIILAGFVGRAQSERHWIEEWVIVTEKHLSFFHPDSKRPSYRVCRKGILGVRTLDRSECPYFPSYHFLAIETVSRVVYLMCRTKDECEDWRAALLQQEEEGRSAPTMSQANLTRDIALMTFDDPMEEYLHKSSIYTCKQRRLLNNRKFAFSSLGKLKFDDREGKNNIHPLTLVQNVLQKALKPLDDSDETTLDDFLDGATELKTANLATLSEEQKMAFYINLYHVMVQHAFLLLGPPNSSFKFVSYWNMVAYEVGDDVFSLTELEHNIIRANMTSPSQFVSRFVLPKSTYKYALKTSDFRVSFALNCGSISNPSEIQIFTAKHLEAQLDTATADYLKVAKVSSSGRTLTLPRVCQWYAGDFGRGRHVDVVRLLAKYLNDQDKARLPPFLSDVHLKYYGYEFKCRSLRLRSAES